MKKILMSAAVIAMTFMAIPASAQSKESAQREGARQEMIQNSPADQHRSDNGRFCRADKQRQHRDARTMKMKGKKKFHQLRENARVEKEMHFEARKTK